MVNDLLGRIGVYRGVNPPTEEGIYWMDAHNAQGWKGPSGFVEIVEHSNNGNPWMWCYWIDGKRCGMPLNKMTMAKWVGPMRTKLQP